VLRLNNWDFEGVAMRETQMALIPRQTFSWLLSVSPAFNRYVIAQLNERLAQFVSIVEAERLETAETRVARCLGWLFNPVLYPGVGARLELTQQEIGYLSGVSRQHVNRALRQLEGAGVLLVEYGSVTVLDLTALKCFRTTP
jgi:CRP/FNR family transcriptional regulator, cyclic AMP receptor protein